MNYLLDRKTKRKKFLNIALLIGSLLLLFFFRNAVWSGLSFVVQSVFRPVLVLGNNIGGRFSGISSFFRSKSSLLALNENLKLELMEKEATLSNYNSILDENIEMKEILGRKIEKENMILAGILAKPNRSLYDTLVIDAGSADGVSSGKFVFALGNIPIGRVAEVYPNSSKVILFSNPGEKTEVVVGRNIFTEAIGRGGGNFEISLLEDLELFEGMEVVLPGVRTYVLGVVEKIISDPRDSHQKALLVSPVNVQELKFVEVEK